MIRLQIHVLACVLATATGALAQTNPSLDNNKKQADETGAVTLSAESGGSFRHSRSAGYCDIRQQHRREPEEIGSGERWIHTVREGLETSLPVC